ncbi:Ni,Fe-hydrogenase III component G [Desulfosarcina cetonica]|uniref:NADH-quinone oxidoreductase subunit C n=1 Tax=Desulfosarcina cetonica TaxID=90730 RepID=UPI0006CFC01B|nr:NADH-quinone oxidoreductase subunit C [Desulfosarcina cetonica]VTR65585.1 Ni,Fe-hydrogenase III component G [Desulfosarcina cetonica]
MIDATRMVSPQDLLGTVTRLKIDGYRLVTLTGVATGTDTVEILYHFDKDLTLRHLRLSAAMAATVPSIASIFPAAVLAENEIQDGFRIRFSGLPMDYRGCMLRTAETADDPSFGTAPSAPDPA